MNIEKANKLRRLVTIELNSDELRYQFLHKAHWRGAQEMLFIMLQLEANFDKSTAEELFCKLQTALHDRDPYDKIAKEL